jgi:hypothetical protein
MGTTTDVLGWLEHDSALTRSKSCNAIRVAETLPFAVDGLSCLVVTGLVVREYEYSHFVDMRSR